MSAMGFLPKLAAASLGALMISLVLAGCNQGPVAGTDRTADQQGAGSGNNAAEAPPQKATRISSNVSPGASNVAVDTRVSVSAEGGTFKQLLLKAVGTNNELGGSYDAGKTHWTADTLLEPGTKYVVASRTTSTDGILARKRTTFSTQDLSLEQQTYPSIQPLQSQVVGVAMPVIVKFDVPVTRRAIFEKHMSVTARPATAGTWHWISDTEVHWRPKTYWGAGTRVHVNVNVNGVDAGNGIFGQMNRHVDFTIGRSVIMKANLASEQMRVFLDGSLARTIPITGGKAGYTTRSGTKAIIEKVALKHMDAATIGIEPGDPEYYDIPDVRYAQRVTYTGEFLHAAPWSTYAQGHDNVSHGCIGMSTDNAAWLFSQTHVGDPVETIGTDRGLEDNNGWTDWNESFTEYKQRSALS